MPLPDVAALLANGVPRVMIMILFLVAYTTGMELWLVYVSV